MPEVNPAQVVMDFQSTLRDQQLASAARRDAEADLMTYQQARAAETQAEVARRTADIERLKAAEAQAKRRALQAKSALDALVKGVEDGVVTIPPPLPGDEAAAARIAELEQALAAQEERLKGVAGSLDDEARRVEGSVRE